MSEPQNVSGLMDQIHELKRQLADAETRGAVKALRYEAERGRAAAIAFVDSDPVAEKRGANLLRRVANAVEARADLIESGEVTLP